MLEKFHRVKYLQRGWSRLRFGEWQFSRSTLAGSGCVGVKGYVKIVDKIAEVNCHPTHVASVLKSHWKKSIKESSLEKFQPMLQSVHD